MGSNKKLRKGYTTGSTATAAAKAATQMLVTGEQVETISIQTPAGVELTLPVEQVEQTEHVVCCAVQKDAGDDPDVTDGIYIFATAQFGNHAGVRIFGGEGIGIVTKEGLSCPVGVAAINPVPQAMIQKEIRCILAAYDCNKGINITLTVPKGKEIAEKTFNERLGIVGGISIIGTSGIVEPMSEKSLLHSIYLEMDVRYAAGKKHIALTPGNYGKDFIKRNTSIADENIIKCSNFVGDTLDYAEKKGFEKILLVGHMGKFIKLAGNIFNTHSKYADCRLEILAAYAAASGATQALILQILDSATVDEGMNKLKQANLLDITLDRILKRIQTNISYRLNHTAEVAVLLFSNALGLLAQSKQVPYMIDALASLEEE